ncbi:universal stress protein [Halostagnicola kamekurae]|uniref:Nucleotide-binding universal stress protein, UspA family n=1 Tax=Halostagnicola kamekurae TaxID=619731 RepID=A0A1I6TF58_9EURY|nr:universal stress protein [Halostagnicola kamekurae]SFS87823.1 Nucleotide-binding universal stress protein, UspA family [Halostagnicola kamekurae]
MYDTLLVPTDGSEAAMDAAKHAYSLGERYDATVHVLAVVEHSESASIVGQGDEKLETLQEDGTEATQKIIKEGLSRDIETVGAVKVGDPDKVILDYADEHNVDMIIMSTHGRSGVGRFLMGSITEQVIRGGEIPVLAIQR